MYIDREFIVLRITRQAAGWEFPVTVEELAQSPFAGPFDEATLRRLDVAMGHFPFARRTRDGRRAWRIEAPERGELDVWLTTDGAVYLGGPTSLNLVYGVFVHLLQACPDVALEDSITGVLHNRKSLLWLVRRDEERRRPRFGADSPETTPPFAA